MAPADLNKVSADFTAVMPICREVSVNLFRYRCVIFSRNNALIPINDALLRDRNPLRLRVESLSINIFDDKSIL